MKQTAVEWLIEGLEKLEYDLEKGNISLDDYIINTKLFKNRAWNEGAWVRDAAIAYAQKRES